MTAPTGPGRWNGLTTIGLALLAVLAAGSEAWGQSAAPDAVALAALKELYRRPEAIPAPADNPLTVERVDLGRRLFAEKRLSANDSVACASCHDPALAFTDGAPLGQGVAKTPLRRHTPTLWNLAWSHALFWDGRASSLEEQAQGPIENAAEMGQPVARGVEKLAADPSYAADFAKAFGTPPHLTAANLLKALASFERTIVSPPTKFDTWILGDTAALSDSEVRGFLLFNGAAKCSVCHSGWAFTDSAFHDIGLPGEDLGRGPIIGLKKVDHAFKTPSLRELLWTAPYMHDGSLSTLEDVLRHYQTGGIARPSRSPDMPPVVALSESERNDLLAFLATLSSERPPRPLAQMSTVNGASAGPTATAIATTLVTQKNKSFQPGAVTLRRGEALTIVNNDTRPHNVRVFDPRLSFNSGVQEPGDKAVIDFPQAGTFEVFCGIHPNMRLTIEVE